MRTGIHKSIISGLVAMAPLMACSTARAQDIISDDFAAPYLQRIEGVTPDAGNAKEVNAATHVIDPWPPYAANRHIPANGERMAGAAERYRDVSKLPLAPPPIAPTPIGVSGLSSAGGATASPASGSSSR
jgi:hypothetical protein